MKAIAALVSSENLASRRAGPPLPPVSLMGITITSKPLAGSFCQRKSVSSEGVELEADSMQCFRTEFPVAISLLISSDSTG